MTTSRRRCIICRRVGPKAELIRYARLEGGPVPDPKRQLAGRGVYTCTEGACQQTFLANWPKIKVRR